MSPNESPFGDPISVYTQEQAIEDGMLAKVEQPELYGFSVPVVITSALHALTEDGDGDLTIRRLVLLTCAKDALDASNDHLFASFTYRVGVEDVMVWAVVDGNGVTVMLPSDY